MAEDLHTGTGSGTWAVDSLQARDEGGNPCVPRSHLKGLLRLSAQALQLAEPFDEALITDLFGKGTGEQDRLIVPMLRSEGAKAKPTLLWSETARVEGGRAPAEETLRTIEFMAAGTELEDTFRVRGDCSDALKERIKKIIRRTNILGSERNRGSHEVFYANKLGHGRPLGLNAG